MELHFFKTSSDFYFYFFHFKFLSIFSLTDIQPALSLHLASPYLVPWAFPLKKMGGAIFVGKALETRLDIPIIRHFRKERETGPS